MGAGFEIPPIMFNFDEVEALVAGIRVMESWGGPGLAHAARSALEKISHALPENRRKEIQAANLYAPGFHVPASTYAFLDPIRKATAERHKLHIGYRDAQEIESQRIIYPLGLAFWGMQWTLLAWCEARNGFRTFRLDRISTLITISEPVPDDPLKSVEEFLRQSARTAD